MIWVPPRRDTVRCTRVGRWSSSGVGPGQAGALGVVRVSGMVWVKTPSSTARATVASRRRCGPGPHQISQQPRRHPRVILANMSTHDQDAVWWSNCYELQQQSQKDHKSLNDSSVSMGPAPSS